MVARWTPVVARWTLTRPKGARSPVPACQRLRLRGRDATRASPTTASALCDGLWLDGSVLRFYDPETGLNLLTTMEAETDRRKAHADRDKAEAKSRKAEADREEAEAKSRQLEAELAELRARFGIP